jgi:N-methylhydantoinase B/oxoprolinase/acetone carboxylase alpha subunit
VAEDLRNGFISKESAREVYKVVVCDDLSVDIMATNTLRRE